MDMSRIELQRYLHTAALVSGGGVKALGEEDMGELAANQELYSLAWYFDKLLLRDLDAGSASHNQLLAAYLGLGPASHAAPVAPSAAERAEEDRLLDECFPQSRYPLNPSQREAVHAALHNPLTVVIGPPGTGKTETIMRILALAVARGESVAMVSSNHSAVDNVVEKVRASRMEGPAPKSDLMARLAERLVPLGNSSDRAAATDDNGESYGFSSRAPKGETRLHGDLARGWEQHIRLDDFCKRGGARCITSTIHSLKKCFADGDIAQYDLVVVDEASQCSVLLGIVAMSSARRIVVVGDDDQLPPVVPESFGKSLAMALGKDAGLVGRMSEGPYDLSSDRLSFLGSCKRVFGPQVEVMLNEHYRCHPVIIGFCNEQVYGGRLKVRAEVAPDAPAFPIGIRWYEGDYRERDVRWEEEKKRGFGNAGEGRWRSSAVNFRQLGILLDEEMAHIRILYRQGKSICFVAPFWAQVRELEAILERELDAGSDAFGHGFADEDERTGEDRPAALTVQRPCEGSRDHKELTVHRSQGREFDCVYLLPVEDGNWEWPWSQGRRLVNVAVSRAKAELHVILSAKLMSTDAQERLVGRVLPVANPADETKPEADQELYVRKLVDYALAHQGLWAAGPAWCGIHKARTASVFDGMCWLQKDLPVGDEDGPRHSEAPSAAEALVLAALAHLGQEGLAIARNVYFSALWWKGRQLYEYVGHGKGKPAVRHFDFALFERDTRRVVALVEVDGDQHRYEAYVDPGLKGGERGAAYHKAQRACGGIQRRDWAKERLVRELGGTCTWLGEPRGHQLCVPLKGERGWRLVPGDGSGGTGLNRLEGWATAPDQLPATSPFLFLRIPTDGSTTEEFGFLVGEGAQARKPDSTLDAYVRTQRERMRACGDFLTVSEGVAKGREVLRAVDYGSRSGWTLTKVLEARGLGTSAAQGNRELERMGVLRRDADTGTVVATSLGSLLGVMSERRIGEGGKPYYQTTYDFAAQQIVAWLLRGM